MPSGITAACALKMPRNHAALSVLALNFRLKVMLTDPYLPVQHRDDLPHHAHQVLVLIGVVCEPHGLADGQDLFADVSEGSDESERFQQSTKTAFTGRLCGVCQLTVCWSPCRRCPAAAAGPWARSAVSYSGPHSRWSRAAPDWRSPSWWSPPPASPPEYTCQNTGVMRGKHGSKKSWMDLFNKSDLMNKFRELNSLWPNWPSVYQQKWQIVLEVVTLRGQTGHFFSHH